MCVECKKESERKEELKRKEELNERKKLHYERFLGMTNIPYRFLERNFENFKSETQKQERHFLFARNTLMSLKKITKTEKV